MDATTIQKLLDTGSQLAQPNSIGETPFAVIPKDSKIESLAHLLPHPTSKTGVAKFHDAASFCRYFMKHRTDTGSSMIYGVRGATPKFIAVFDDHDDATPGWRRFAATFVPQIADDYTVWTKHSGARMSQEDFARFIEDQRLDIIEPASTLMIEVANRLEATKKVNFASGIRLANGQAELQYQEEIKGTIGKGKIEVPEVFTIGIEIVEGAAPYKIDARLRYRIDGGKLVLWYDLARHDKVLDAALKDLWGEIEAATHVQILNGEPAA